LDFSSTKIGIFHPKNWDFHPKNWDFSSTQMVFMSFSLFMKKKNLEKNFVFSGDG
jgi:hypothetical protein